MTTHPSKWRRRPLAVLIGYALLTVALTWPLPLRLATAVPNDIGDPLLNTWILAWDSHALLTDPAHLFNANIFHPLPNTLAYSEHLLSTAGLALPLQLLAAEPLLAYNFSLLLAFPLAAFGMYLLTLHWTHRRDAALIAGLIFGFAPYRLAAIAHLQLLTCQWLPFALLFLDKAICGRNRPKLARYLVAFDLFLTMQILASWYLAVYTGLVVGLYLLGSMGYLRGPARRNRRWGLAGVLLLAALAALPVAWPYLALLAELRAARPLELALTLAAHPTDFLAAAPFNTIFGPLTELFRRRPGFTEENMLFVGLIAPLLAALGLATLRKSTATRRRLSLILGLILLFSLLLTLPAPYAALARLLPPSTIVRVPPRWIIPALFALAGLAGLGYAALSTRLPARFSGALLLLATSLLLAETTSLPLPLAAVENRAALNPAYHWLAQQPHPETTALIELPLHSAPHPEYPEVKRLYAATLGWWRLVNGYSGYTPPRQPRLGQALAGFPDAAALTALQNPALNPNPTSPFFLLVHPGEAPFDRARWEDIDRWQAEATPELWLVGQFAGDYLYRIVPSADFLAGPPLASFGPEQTIHLQNLTVSQSTTGTPVLHLYWQVDAAPVEDYTVFIHLHAVDGFVRSQADGPPVAGHWPTSRWQPGRPVQDSHPLPPTEDYGRVDQLAIGLYAPATGERLPAFGPGGQPLPDNAILIPLR